MDQIVLVGKPNVGKSSLFNRLIGRREAVVADVSGVTRDLKEAVMLYGNRRITLVDTGGLWSGDRWEAVIRQKVEQAIWAAAAVVFVTDPRAGLTAQDQEVADWLRRFGKPVVLVGNKLDAPTHEPLLAELWGLGFGEPLAVSSEHARGLDRLMERLTALLPEDRAEVPEIAPVRIALIGRPNVGKSSLLNAITGSERVIVSEQPGTTRDSIDVEFDYAGQRFVIVDTAGLRRKGGDAVEEYAMLRSRSAMERADLVWLVLSPEELGDFELKLTQEAYRAGRPVVLVVNKWDLIEDARLKEVERGLEQQFALLGGAPKVYTSALNSYGIHDMLAEAIKLRERWQSRRSTAELNRWLAIWQLRQPTPNFKGKPLRLKFITQAETAPPTFVIFCNRADYVTRAYEHFLINRIRSDLDLAGVPVRLVWKERRDRHKEEDQESKAAG